jgi:hypothetical protein
VLAYQTQLENLCDQAMREKDQKKLTKLMDQVLQLLAENQESGGEVSSRHSCCIDPTNRIGRINTSGLWLVPVPCKSCGSLNQSTFTGEVAIHFPGLKNIDKPIVWVFPKLVVCLDCGTTEFTAPNSELGQLAKGDAAAAG